MRMYLYRFPLLIMFILLISVINSDSSSYVVRGSDIKLPENAIIGSFRRTIEPFKNWSMICDEFSNLKKNYVILHKMFLTIETQ